MTSEPTRHANAVSYHGDESLDPWLADASVSPYMKGRVWVFRSATGREYSNPNGPGLFVPGSFGLAAGLEPDAQHTADSEPEAAEPTHRVNPILLAWRYDRLRLMLSIVAGIVTGGAFLMMAWVMHLAAAHPAAVITTAAGSVILLVTSPGWVVFGVWMDLRHLSQPPQPEPTAE